jgi:ferredoxin-type protein NapG
MPDDKPVDRRRFFREGLKEFLRPLAKAVDPIEKVVKQIGALDDAVAGQKQGANPYNSIKPTAPPAGAVSRSTEPPPPPLEFWLRPPGALDEPYFGQACARSGNCVKACPAQCIIIDASGQRGNGAPFIDADMMACVVCADLACMSVCPSGALVKTPLANIDMGTAEWDGHMCTRTYGDSCQICVDKCPLGTAAIELVDNKIVVKDNGCIGCGVCQHECPTTPKSIYVVTRNQRMSRSCD